MSTGMYCKIHRLLIRAPGADPDPTYENLYWYGTEENETKLALIIFFDLFICPMEIQK
jgi:hypothetical protein